MEKSTVRMNQAIDLVEDVQQGVDQRAHAAQLCILVSRGASVSVENPQNSYFWITMQMWAKQHHWMQQVWESLKDNI